MSPFWILLESRTTTAVIKAEILQFNRHQQTNTQLFTGQMPFLLPNQQCQSTEGKISYSTDLLTPRYHMM